MDMQSAIALLGFVGICFLAAMSGAIFRAGEWYERLAKPWWRPPRWLFAPAWAVLYLTIAVSGWLVWREVGFAAQAFAVYGVSLGFNAAWSGFFFGLRRPDLAFADIVLLWLSIAATILVFYPLEHNSALLLLPYLCWVSFAAMLNLTIWRMNRQTVTA
jgi:tryptophan-rich sensory protein